MTGIITAVNQEAVDNNDGLIVGDDIEGSFYRLPKRTNGVLVDSKTFNGVGSFRAQPLRPLMGKRVSFSINWEGEAYNITVLDNKI